MSSSPLAALIRILRFVGEPWIAPTCVGCGTEGPSPCATCLDRLLAAPSEGPIDGLDDLLALIAYDERSRPFVTALKQFGDLGSVAPLLAPLAELVDEVIGDGIGGRWRPARGRVVVTWAPTTASRRRRRGHDQARLLAADVARRLGLPLVELLHRPDGPSQEGRTAAERRRGPRFGVHRDAFGLPGPGTVIVVDDVVTTGSTMAAAAEVLRLLGAEAVVGLALARTPAPGAAGG